ncbi:MAG: Glycosyltransferase [uncultured bacterium]|uniref:Glycosyltransferase subfamily 4-like N-terminal domain-containing protein n=1 Tax=Candidatus Curtissbacteria bacterium RIFOXYA1_FULL_41_14 TaxID=1797737 RepID=A0A1F5HAV3_9BACT|nr:MAG: Glycosyltransferase [uncultured bacterium]KKR58864.1 MAG: Glycosyltransferase [Candidatus Curtissbacteria bacterium GW2011_GWB1_40_28]KKR62409.1 MAG: Glycosyltransferase [Microgenomates group bacterium GW2011_GWC1_40_35]KKR66390.1 MAG: Glycosyltransferase [Candidatus Curtissbacteria bacterium GW2011_GWA1_40_47]KKR77765.1 MAG: Glycosyltransferase [Candidatus Curtissbacteria bacterium GW2011_GWD1_40_8]KKS02577.1 MAG: Glycosyltransferase [Candidatus Curtissbacteria bacterium GW2011_GWC2_4
MKILMITPYLPYPLVSGGQIRTYNLLKNLAPKHQITLASFIREDAERKYLNELMPFCRKIIIFKRRKAWSPVNIILAGITPFPFLVSIYFDISVRSKIKRELESENYDLIHAETFYVMPNIPQTKIPIFLVEQVIEYLVYQSFVKGLPLWMFFIKPFLLADVFKIKWWERYYWRKAKRLAAMSDDDRLFIQNHSPLKVDVIANGVDIDYFAKTEKLKPKSPTVLFVGQFKWLPNRDATKFLVEEIWPKIKSQIKTAKLWIVGRNPPLDILKFTGPDVQVDGEVEDVRLAYAKADVLLAPIRNGRGTKYKILEAMATNTPIIGSKLAVEGIHIRNGKEAFVAETASDLAAKTLEVLKNPKLGQELASRAYQLVKSQYDWKKISSELDRVYQEVGGKN